MKTVFFGPFIGELGWEISYWHGWVKKMCREQYQDYRKIAASYPGRGPFYPETDEFWPHPPEITKLKISQRGYITDFWENGSGNKSDVDGNIQQYLEKLLEKYQETLPSDTIFYVPFKLNRYKLQGHWYLFGVLFLRGLPPKTFSISFNHQIFDELKPTKKGEEFLRKNLSPKTRIIAVFPRYRLVRRVDKNWPKEKYDLLIKNLQKNYPNHAIGIFGAPKGAYYTEGVPSGCLNLINLDEKIRFSVQLAVLKKADLVVGSVSGSLLVALLAKCPVVEWGIGISKEPTHKQNFLKTRLIYWPEINPSVETIEKLIKAMIEKNEESIIYPEFSEENWRYKEKQLFIKKIKNLFKIFIREILAKIILFYFLKIKKLKEGLIN